MSIRLALPLNRLSPCLVRAGVARRGRRPANDNPGTGPGNLALHAALRHFSQHGLAAAQQARLQAEAAAARGDAEDFAWWRSICGTLDRRMAREMDRELDHGCEAAGS